MTGLSVIAVSGPFAASMAAVTVQGLRIGRRRTGLNRALHELRRPLQAIALAVDAGSFSPGAIESSVQLAAVALERLDSEINGGGHPRSRAGAIPVQPVAESSVARWVGPAKLAGGSLALRWKAGGAVVVCDPDALGQALDNLIVNAIEHGGPEIVVEARCHENRLRVSVTDPGGGASSSAGGDGKTGLRARLSGRRRHGHGLAVVSQVAAAHGGRFALNRGQGGSLAILELPLAARRAGISA